MCFSNDVIGLAEFDRTRSDPIRTAAKGCEDSALLRRALL